MKKIYVILLICFVFGCTLHADSQAKAVLYKTAVRADEKSHPVGRAEFYQISKGVKICVFVQGIEPGKHGFHVHENGDCSSTLVSGKVEKAGAAGGHYDPLKLNRHAGPYLSGHAGDLPVLTADQNGQIDMCVVKEGLTIREIENRSVIIHAGGDNYSDTPKALGGGGERLICGIIRP